MRFPRIPSPDVRDVHAYGGAFLFALGIGLVYWPLAPMALGLFLTWLGLRRV